MRFITALLFFVVLAAMTFGWEMSLGPGLSVKNAFLYVLLAYIAVETVVTRNRRPEALSVILPFTLLVVYATLSWITVVLLVDYPSYPPIGAFIALKSRLIDQFLTFLVFFYALRDRDQAVWVLEKILWMMIIVNIVSMIDTLNIPDLGLFSEKRGRAGGPIGEHNQYGVLLVSFIPAFIAMAIAKNGIARYLAAVGAICSAAALLLTISRGAMVGLIAGSIISVIYLRQLLNKKVVFAFAVAALGFGSVIVTLLLILGFGDILYERLIAQSASVNVDKLSSGRAFIWSNLLEKMIEHPTTFITGYGWDSYWHFRDFQYAPHSVYLQVLFELGLVGLTGLVMIFVNVIRIGKHAAQAALDNDRVILMGMVFGTMSVLFATIFVDVFSPWMFIWAYIGVAMRVAASHLEGRVPSHTAT